MLSRYRISPKTFFAFALWLTLFVGCSGKNTSPTELDLDRVRTYFQQQRYAQQWDGKEYRTARDILIEACERYNIDFDALKAKLRSTDPELVDRILTK